MDKQLWGLLSFFLLPFVWLFLMVMRDWKNELAVVLFIPTLIYFCFLVKSYESWKLAIAVACPQRFYEAILSKALRFEIPFFWLRRLVYVWYIRYYKVCPGDAIEPLTQYKSLAQFRARALEGSKSGTAGLAEIGEPSTSTGMIEGCHVADHFGLESGVSSLTAEAGKNSSGISTASPGKLTSSAVNPANTTSSTVAVLYRPCDGYLLALGDFSDSSIGKMLAGIKCTPLELFGDFAESPLLDPQVKSSHKLSFALFNIDKPDCTKICAPCSFALQKIIFINGVYFPAERQTLEKISGLLRRSRRTVLVGEAESCFFAIVAFGECIVAGYDPVCLKERNVKVDLQFTIGEEIGNFVFGGFVMVILETEIFYSLEALQYGRGLAGTPLAKLSETHNH